MTMTALITQLPDLAAAAAWAPSLAQAFVGLACDLALVIDAHGVITFVALGSAAGLAAMVHGWRGSPWAATVSDECRPKISSLLAEVASHGMAPRREVTLTGLSGASLGLQIPVAYTAMRLGPSGPILAVGHDLRAAASMQQRFLVAQRDLEQGYQHALDTLAAPALGPGRASRAMARLFPAAAGLLGLDEADAANAGPATATASRRMPRGGGAVRHGRRVAPRRR